jgi:C4-type Zn-finger protein
LKPQFRPPLRHCPICGIAMQAKKTRDDIPRFDLYECLTCYTTIREAKPAVNTTDPAK